MGLELRFPGLQFQCSTRTVKSQRHVSNPHGSTLNTGREFTLRCEGLLTPLTLRIQVPDLVLIQHGGRRPNWTLTGDGSLGVPDLVDCLLYVQSRSLVSPAGAPGPYLDHFLSGETEGDR